MRHSLKRTIGIAFVLLLFAAALIAIPGRAGAAMFAFRPGPIDRPLAIAAADFDRDGHDDIVVANFEAGTLQILLAQPDGTYAGLSGPFGVGSATFVTPTSGPFVLQITDLNPGDVDGDSVPNATDNCPNSYNPIDAVTGVQPDANGNGVGDACEVGEDTDGDGIIDVPIDTDGDGVYDFDPVTLALDNCPRRPNPGQEDADGDHVGDLCALSPDIVLLVASQGPANPFGAVRIRLGDGEGGLVGRSSMLTGVAPGGLALANFDGDAAHLIDLAVTNSPNGLVQVFTGQADGAFTSQSVLLAGKGPQGVAAADIDGDGHIDLVTGDRTDSTLSVFRNGGTALATKPTATVPTAAGPTVVLSGHLNADGADDLVVLDQGDKTDPKSPTCEGSIEVFLGAADGVPVHGQTIALGAGHQPRAGLLKDFDEDGQLDLVVADYVVSQCHDPQVPADGQVLIYAGQGDGTFALRTTLPIAGGEPADVTAMDIDAHTPGGTDLAVLDYQGNRVLLYLGTGGLGFAPAPVSPASSWQDTSALSLFAADTIAGVDIVMTQRHSARLDRLSGIGNQFFRADPTTTIAGLANDGAADVSSFSVGDLRFDNRLDMAVLDGSAGKMTVITNELTDELKEQGTYAVGVGTERLGLGSLVSSVDDVDRDGIPNVSDDCPAIYNPPCLVAGDYGCTVTPACTDTSILPLRPCDPGDPTTLDPSTGQCDSDQNGIGDHCEVLSSACLVLDSDFDLRSDYNPTALKLVAGGYDYDGDGIPNLQDNCPTVPNLDQTDTDGNGIGDACQILSDGQTVDPDNDGVPTYDPGPPPKHDNCPAIYNPGQEDNDNDGVGNACVVTAALDNCPYASNLDQADTNGDGVGDRCSFPPLDVLAPDPATGEVMLLAGDGSGYLHPADASPLSGLAAPSAAGTGSLTLGCFLPTVCFGKSTYDIAVATRGAPGDFSDDGVTVYIGDGFGAFSPLPPAPATGDPKDLLIDVEQPVCGLVNDPANPNLRLDPDGRSAILAAVEPGTSTLETWVVSNQNILDPTKSSLVHPVGHPIPLPVPAQLITSTFADLNHDGRDDLVALSSQPGGPSHITVYMALGNGLFYTDDTFNPAPIDDEITLMAQGNTHLQTNLYYPDLVLFSKRDQAPIVLTNIMNERADIDGSGRVDGYDLAILASAFGSTRGEDFTILPNGTLEQTGVGFGRKLVGTGSFVPGQELPGSDGVCDYTFDPLSGSYGLPVDINLDGVVDGLDLAFLASLFGRTLQAP
jgi:hypothetical protein